MSNPLGQRLMGGTEATLRGPKVTTGTRRTSMQRRADVFESRYGYSWDLCLIFPAVPPENCWSVDMFMRKLHAAGLETYLYHSIQDDEVICKIRAPLERLARYASDVEHKMLMEESRVKREIEKGSKEPPIAPRHITHDPTITLYRPHEYIYGKYGLSARLSHMYACPEYLEHPFSSVHRIKLMRRIIESREADGCGLDIVLFMQKGSIKAFFPFHDNERRKKLFAKWVKPYANPANQPLDEIKDYLGEKISLYFALLGHYTAWLAPFSAIALIMFADQLIEWKLDSTLAPYFSVFVSFWAVLMLEYWKRQESRLAMRWGMSDFERAEHDRPQFKGDTMVSFVDGSNMTYYPSEEHIKLLVSLNTIVVAMLALAIGLVGGIFLLEWEWTKSDIWVWKNLGSYFGSFLLSVEIQIMNLIYKKVALWTTQRENHRTDTIFEDTLIAKLAVFQFVNSYASLFYLAFVSPYTDDGCSYDSCLASLCQTLGFIFCTRLFVANCFEIYLPRWQARWKAKQERKGVSDNVAFSLAEIEYTLNTYDEMMGTISDMSEIAIQFGYVTLFVVSFPLAPTLAYVSNYIEVRIDATRIMYEHRRPFPRGAQDIGTWQLVWTAIAIVAVGTNAGLIFFTAQQLDWDGEDLAWGFIIWQYLVLIIMLFFSLVVPDVPRDVSIQLGRQAFIISKVIDQIPDDKLESAILRVPGKQGAIVDFKTGDDYPPPPQRPRLPKFSWF